MTNLSLVHLNVNKLSGRLPPKILRLPLIVLNVSNNSFSGLIPTELGDAHCLQNLDLSINNFSASRTDGAWRRPLSLTKTSGRGGGKAVEAVLEVEAEGRGVGEVAELEQEGVGGTKEAVDSGIVGGGAEVGDELREEGGPGQGEVVRTDDGEGLGELRTDAAGDFEHGRDNGRDNGASQALAGLHHQHRHSLPVFNHLLPQLTAHGFSSCRIHGPRSTHVFVCPPLHRSHRQRRRPILLPFLHLPIPSSNHHLPISHPAPSSPLLLASLPPFSVAQGSTAIASSPSPFLLHHLPIFGAGHLLVPPPSSDSHRLLHLFRRLRLRFPSFCRQRVPPPSPSRRSSRWQSWRLQGRPNLPWLRSSQPSFPISPSSPCSTTKHDAHGPFSSSSLCFAPPAPSPSLFLRAPPSAASFLFFFSSAAPCLRPPLLPL